MLAYFAAEENASAVMAFQPTVLKGLGHTAVAAQVHAIPVYCVAFVASLSGAWISEHYEERFSVVLTGSLIALVGLIVELVHQPAASGRYAGMFLITAGT
jgi:hypothetical protein